MKCTRQKKYTFHEKQVTYITCGHCEGCKLKLRRYLNVQKKKQRKKK